MAATQQQQQQQQHRSSSVGGAGQASPVERNPHISTSSQTAQRVLCDDAGGRTLHAVLYMYVYPAVCSCDLRQGKGTVALIWHGRARQYPVRCCTLSGPYAAAAAAAAAAALHLPAMDSPISLNIPCWRRRRRRHRTAHEISIKIRRRAACRASCLLDASEGTVNFPCPTRVCPHPPP